MARRRIVSLLLLAALGFSSLRAFTFTRATTSRNLRVTQLPNLRYRGSVNPPTPDEHRETTAASPAAAVPGCVPAPAGLISWWPFDGNGLDFYLNHNAGLDAGPAPNTPVFVSGKVDRALQFDGVDDRALVAGSSASTLNVGAGDGFTIDLWINPADVTAQQPLLEWNNGVGGQGVHLWIAVPLGGGGDGHLFANIRDTSGGSHFISSSGAPVLFANNTYQHVALIYAKSFGIARLFVNGNIVAEEDLGTFTPQTSYDLYFGNRASTYFKGQMDEIEIFNRVLAPSEIQAIYNAGNAGKCKIRYVTNNGDNGGVNPNPGAGTGTLRQAIIDSNGYAASQLSLNTIGFNILGGGVHTISPGSPLPTITGLVRIDGTTQPGFNGTPLIELSGVNAGQGAVGIHCNAPVEIRGLVINRFGTGIIVNAGLSIIAGNYIGTDPSANVALGNGNGIEISSPSFVGGTGPAERNVISGNRTGISIGFPGPSGSVAGTIVRGNYIGTNAAGNAPLGNVIDGIVISGSSDSTAVFDVTIGGTSAANRNIISGNGRDGIHFVFAKVNLVHGNFIGTDATGTVPIGNGRNGIHFEPIAGSNGATLIGGTAATTPGAGCAGACNLISGNGANGISMGPQASNKVLGNYIGTNAAGTARLANGENGILVQSRDLSIGGSTPEERNVISGNGQNGVRLEGNATGIFVSGNFIGTNAAGTAAIGNGQNGVQTFNGASNNTIGGAGGTPGGPCTEACNLISGNGNHGVSIGTSGNKVQGNYLGTSLAGTEAIGNAEAGIAIASGANQIGGTTASTRNVIAANVFGIVIGGNANQNVVQGNFIGTDAAGTAGIGNGRGIMVFFGASNNTIGGAADGAGNTVAFNTASGVLVDDSVNSFSPPTRNIIQANSIFSNGGLGIDLRGGTENSFGITANDSADGDMGSNDLQNFPVLTSALSSAGSITIQGALNSAANQTFRVEFFANAVCDGSGHGEGQTFIGAIANVLTSSGGNATIGAVFPKAVPVGAFITATATDTNGNTSEFSNCIQVTGPTPTPTPTPTNVVQFSASNYNVHEECTTVTITVNRLGESSVAASVEYNTSDAVATERKDYITALGKLNFAAGETTKSFAVLINEDSNVEGNETFNVSLANPSGVGLGTAAATITIVDDGSEPANNAIDDPRNYVCQQYHDFLNRQPDPGGWDFWTNELTSCGSNQSCIEARRISVSAAFFLSIEFQNTGYLVERLYKSAYGDASGASTFPSSHQLGVPIVRFKEFLADTQKIGQGVVVLQPGWEQQLETNKQAFVTEFVTRSRFATAFAVTMSPSQFVDALNANAGNILSPSERATAINFFGNAGDSSNLTARAQVLRQVAEDNDLVTSEFNRAFVLMQFFGYLRRNPNDPQDTDYTGYDFWLTKLNEFNGNFQNAEMVKAFITSIEYRQRFGS